MSTLPDLAPRPVARAAATVAEREQDVRAAKSAVDAAKSAVTSAIVDDVERAAQALDRGERDPGRQGEDVARAKLADAERRYAVEEARLRNARASLDETIAKALPAWTTASAKEVEEAETAALDLVAQLEQAVDRRARAQKCLSWLQATADGTKLPNLDAPPPMTMSTLVRNPVASPYELLTVSDLLGHVRGGIEKSSLTSEPQTESRPALHVAAS